MARNIAAAGYESQAKGIFAPANVTTKILQQYHESALTPQIARSDFFTEEELQCGSKVIFGVERRVDMFGMDTDNNEAPELLDGPDIETASLQICQLKTSEIKLSNIDKRMMCSNFEKWEEALRNQLDRGVKRYVDAYSVPKILASASIDNVGIKAGMNTHSYNLGDQGSNALTVDSPTAFEDVIFNLEAVAKEAGVMADPTETDIIGYVGKPVLLIPDKFTRYARRLIKEQEAGCCTDDNVLRTGVIGELYGMRVIPTQFLTPVNAGAAGWLNHIVLLDPTRILHAFDIINDKWWEDKREDYFIFDYIFDTEVLDPHAVSIATVKA